MKLEENKSIRQPIITILGHVDHGKTTLLDGIRGSTMAQREAGLITQHIGASEVPLETIKQICGDLLNKFKLNFTIPGLLFVDTPGHEAFSNLRKRGGSIADLAVLIIDINQGIQPQTKEAIEILKTFKVPFIIAANKVDLLSNWKSHSKIFIENLSKQMPTTKEHFNNCFYKLLGNLSELGFDSNLYTEVDNYAKTIAIVPLSAKTGEGVAELLALITGLTQKFLEGKLRCDISKGAKGTVLEVKEETGLGTVADIVIYDGTLDSNDTVVIGCLDGVIETKIRALLKPKPLSESRDKKSEFEKVNYVCAATGVRLVAPNLEKVSPGVPIISAKNKKEVELAKEKIIKEIEGILIETQESGIILKTDTLGSLEAVSSLLLNKGIEIKKANVGNITKADITEAKANLESEPTKAFVLGFHVKISEDAEKLAKEYGVVALTDNVIYKLLEKYEEKLDELNKKIEIEKLAGLVWPGKFKIMSGYVFRQKNPAIVGVEVIAGKIKQGAEIINADGEIVGTIKKIESDGKPLTELSAKETAAVSIIGPTVGRQIKENEDLYSEIHENSFRTFKGEAKKFLSQAEINILKEIAEIKRKEKETWGM